MIELDQIRYWAPYLGFHMVKKLEKKLLSKSFYYGFNLLLTVWETFKNCLEQQTSMISLKNKKNRILKFFFIFYHFTILLSDRFNNSYFKVFVCTCVHLCLVTEKLTIKKNSSNIRRVGKVTYDRLFFEAKLCYILKNDD